MRSLIFVAGLLIVGCGKEGSSTSASDAQSSTPIDTCPSDISADQVGRSCKVDGKLCSSSPSSPRMLMCEHGKWTELSVPPPPSTAAH